MPALPNPQPTTTESDPLRLALSDHLGHQYDIVRLIGRGGMGAVYLARDRVLERAVAIKVLPPDTSATAEARERFRREARTVANLTHHNIVPLYAFGETGELGYYVMGYIRGESLADRLQRERQIDPDEARRLLAELADALDFAHRSGVVHRDIKPDNILLDDATGRPLLTDFGIAKAQASGKTLTQLGMVVGTPHYMSPEQASGDRDIDGRSDLYSLGVVAYAMLAGRPPFQGGSLQDILIQHLTAQPPPLRQVAPHVPEDLADAVMRCLEKDPAKRWPDGRSLRQSLGADVTSDTALPLELRDLTSIGLLIAIAATLTGYGLLYAAFHEGRIGIFAGWWAFYPLFVIWGYVFSIRRARTAGNSWRQIGRVMAWQPRWWPFGWPARFRRPGDVASRLPLPVRIARLCFAAAIAGVLLALLSLPFMDNMTGPTRMHGPPPFVGESLAWLSQLRRRLITLPLLLLSFGGMTVLTVSFLTAVIFGKRRGLGFYEGMRLASVSTVSPFWEQSHVLPLLLEPKGRDRIRVPASPHELMRGIATAAERLTGPVRTSGADAVAAAREALGELEAIDRELKAGAGSDDAEERARLEQRLAQLDAQGAGSPERAQMRELLAGQLALLQRMSAAREEIAARRAAIEALLQSLWRELDGIVTVPNAGAANAAGIANGAGPHGDESTRLRSVIQELRARTGTFAETRSRADDRETVQR